MGFITDLLTLGFIVGIVLLFLYIYYLIVYTVMCLVFPDITFWQTVAVCLLLSILKSRVVTNE